REAEQGASDRLELTRAAIFRRLLRRLLRSVLVVSRGTTPRGPPRRLALDEISRPASPSKRPEITRPPGGPRAHRASSSPAGPRLEDAWPRSSGCPITPARRNPRRAPCPVPTWSCSTPTPKP